MRFIIPPFKICNKLIDNVLLIHKSRGKCTTDALLKSVGKTIHYVKKGYDFLIDMKLFEEKDDYVLIAESYYNKASSLKDSGSGDYSSIIKSAISDNKEFKDYTSLLNQGKSVKESIKFIKSVYNIQADESTIEKSLDTMLNYLSIAIENKNSKKSKIVIPDKSFLWINDEGHLMYDEEAHTEKLINTIKLKSNQNGHYINPNRLEELKAISNSAYDKTKLIRLLEEINIAYSNESYFSVGVLVRSVIDHIPPVFGKSSFNEVTENYGTKSFKDLMRKLNNSSRKISDSMLHTHIRKKEVLPNSTQIDFKSELDFLLGEIIRINK